MDMHYQKRIPVAIYYYFITGKQLNLLHVLLGLITIVLCISYDTYAYMSAGVISMISYSNDFKYLLNAEITFQNQIKVLAISPVVIHSSIPCMCTNAYTREFLNTKLYGMGTGLSQLAMHLFI